MRLSVISFTENGNRLSEYIAKILKADTDRKIEAAVYTKCRACLGSHSVPDSPAVFVEASVKDWAKEQLQEGNAMLFIGACGIAVRSVAPFLIDKLQDTPVLVMDETGKYVIPILSGHMGGANELAVFLAEKTGAEPVITTATDLRGKFAVDVFARRNGFFIVNKDGIAKVSAKILAGKAITISIETGHAAAGLPVGVELVPYPPAGPVDVAVTSQEDVFDTAILLKPKEYSIGIGCRKGKQAGEIAAFVAEKLHGLGIHVSQIFAAASVAQKSEEPGILAWCQKERVPFFTYTAEELQEIKGNFQKSAFVKEQVGVDNVCERAAVKACGPGGILIVPKAAKDGMTIAVAKREWKAKFYEA